MNHAGFRLLVSAEKLTESRGLTVLGYVQKSGKGGARMTSEELGQKLRPKERLFVLEYLKDWNGTQAAIRTGYKAGKSNASAAVTASRLLRDERVKAYLDALIRESVDSKETSRESVILRTLELYRRCTKGEPVLVYDSEAKAWVESGEWKFDSKGAARALELLSKIMGYDAPVKIDSDGVVVELRPQVLSDGD